MVFTQNLNDKYLILVLEKKNAAFWHTLIITTACVCVCIQSSASAQGYLCSIIVAHH